MRSHGVSKSIRSLHDRVFSYELVSDAVLFPPPCPSYCVCFNRQVSGRKRVRLHLEPQPRRHLHLISMTKHCSLFLHHMQNLALSQSPDVLSQTGKQPPPSYSIIVMFFSTHNVCINLITYLWLSIAAPCGLKQKEMYDCSFCGSGMLAFGSLLLAQGVP